LRSFSFSFFFSRENTLGSDVVYSIFPVSFLFVDF
jgi:hypothetical protein